MDILPQLEFKKMIRYNWKFFSDHLQRFYPLTGDFIDKFSESLSWNHIESNEQILWNTNMLIRHQDKFRFIELCKNESIYWNDEKIELFEDNIQWFYLSQNKNLPINNNFLQKYGEKIDWRFIGRNINWTSELKEEFGHRVQSWEQYDHKTNSGHITIMDILKDKSIDIQYEFSLSPRANINSLSINDLTNMAHVIDWYKCTKYFSRPTYEMFYCLIEYWKFTEPVETFYNQLISPFVDNETIKSLFNSRYTTLTKFYQINFVTPNIDSRSNILKPESRQKSNSPPVTRSFLPKDTELEYEFERRPSDTGYFPSILKLNTIGASLIIDDILKKYIVQLKLPQHNIYKVNLILDEHNYYNVNYWLIHFPYDSIYQSIDYSIQNNWYICDINLAGMFSLRNPVKEKMSIPSQDQLISIRAVLDEEHTVLDKKKQINPYTFFLRDDYDIYTIRNKIVVSEKAKKLLESVTSSDVVYNRTTDLKIQKK